MVYYVKIVLSPKICPGTHKGGNKMLQVTKEYLEKTILYWKGRLSEEHDKAYMKGYYQGRIDEAEELIRYMLSDTLDVHT